MINGLFRLPIYLRCNFTISCTMITCLILFSNLFHKPFIPIRLPLPFPPFIVSRVPYGKDFAHLSDWISALKSHHHTIVQFLFHLLSTS